jgi:hypothetical protein
MNNAIVEQSPCFLFPLSSLPLPPFVSLYLLGTLLAMIGSCSPQSQVARKLISPFPFPTPYTPHSKILTPWGFPELNIHYTKTTSRTWVTRSRTHTITILKDLVELRKDIILSYRRLYFSCRLYFLLLPFSFTFHLSPLFFSPFHISP